MNNMEWHPDGCAVQALNGVQGVACFLWALLLIQIFGGPAKGQLYAPVTAYWKVGLTNSVGPALGIEALKNISYPAQVGVKCLQHHCLRVACCLLRDCKLCCTSKLACASHLAVKPSNLHPTTLCVAQVLAKSCKMIPVMLMGTILGGKVYSSLEYVCALLIAAGISLFAKQSAAEVTKKLASPNAPLGYLLCFLNLAFDGYTNAMQVRVPGVIADNAQAWKPAAHFYSWHHHYIIIRKQFTGSNTSLYYC